MSKSEEDTYNEIINGELREDKKKRDKEIKMLLLGTGESGKSTIAKQLKLLHIGKFSDDELMSYKPVISNNIFIAFKNILEAAKRFNYMDRMDANSKTLANYFLSSDPLKAEVNAQTADYVKRLWDNPVIKQTVGRSNEFQMPDSTSYLVQNVDRICSSKYIPTEDDVLRCRARTTGIIEIEFIIEKFKFRVVDVGGQRSERKKWIHCFEGVTALIFCVALSEYDQKLYEDDSVNRMKEALELFEEVCNSEWFAQTDIILFLNKSDLLAEKIRRVDLKTCFPEYNGGADYGKACDFIRDEFFKLNKHSKEKQIYSHITCATNKDNVRTVFEATQSMILKKNLDAAGFS